MPDSGDDAAMSAVRLAIELLRLAAIHSRRGDHHERFFGKRTEEVKEELLAEKPGADEGALAEEAVAETCREASGIIEPARFAPGDPDNLTFTVKTVSWDEGCSLVSDNLGRMGIPFAKTVAAGTASFEIGRAHGPAAAAMLGALCANVRGFDGSRIDGMERLAQAAAVPRTEAVWRGVCETKEQARLVRTALTAQGIAHHSEVDPETGTEEIFIAQSEIEEHGYRIPRAIRDMPGMPVRIAATDRAMRSSPAQAVPARTTGARRPRGQEALERDLRRAKETAAQMKGGPAPRQTKSRSV